MFSPAIRRMRGTPKHAHPRSVRRGGARGRLAARVARAAVQESAIEVEQRSPTTSQGLIVQTSDQAHSYERLRGRKPEVDRLDPLSREMYELSSQINAPTAWAARLAAPLLAALIATGELGDVQVTPTPARRAAGRRGDRGAARGRGALSSPAAQLEAARPRADRRAPAAA